VRIVQFVTNLDIGGMERLAVDLALCQLAEGHEPLLYCLTYGGRLADEAAARGIRTHTFNKRPGPRLNTLWSVIQQLRRDRPDVLHTHNHLVHHYGVAAAIFAGVPVIVNTRHRAEHFLVNAPEGSQVSAGTKDMKSDLIFRATLPWVGAVVAISESTRNFFVEHRGIPAAKTRVILNGARLDRFFNAPAHPGSVLPRVRYGIAARLVREKDHFTLLRAFSAVVARVPGAELQIAGDGPMQERLEAFATELNLNNRVTFLGALSDIPQFLSQLDVFVLSSLTEGMPVSLLEAMAAGLPIVATRVGGVEEAVASEENAYLAEPGDAEELAEAMIRMANRADLAHMGSSGREIVRRRFSIEETWRQYHQLFLALGANK
jgi:glycosyltransferase involved in cell wall biosynthesis